MQICKIYFDILSVFEYFDVTNGEQGSAQRQ